MHESDEQDPPLTKTKLGVMQADIDQVIALKELLEKFALSTGLRLNYSKSSMVPLNVEENLASALATELGCQVATMPFTYLGFPLGTSRPTIQDMLPLVECLDRILTSTSIFLTLGARLQLVTSTLCFF